MPGRLREILSRYLDLAPAALRFDHNAYGKPSVAGAGLHFNVSHSGDWAMLAVSAEQEVGIDIERIDPSFVQEQIPERFFSPREVAQLRSLPPSEQTGAFFRCWTRKEAYIKARGLGLALALDSFDSFAASRRSAALVARGRLVHPKSGRARGLRRRHRGQGRGI